VLAHLAGVVATTDAAALVLLVEAGERVAVEFDAEPSGVRSGSATLPHY
jgi:hypothetical protein